MPSLDLGTLEKLDGLDDATRRRVNYLVARYRSTVRAAHNRGHSRPEEAHEAKAIKLAAFGALQQAGFNPVESLAVFQHLANRTEENA